MKSSETIFTKATPAQTEQPFFSARTEAEESFFGPDSTNVVSQASFFSPNTSTATPAIQPKLTIGAPNAPYEKEADTVADRVVQRMTASAPGTAVNIQKAFEEPEENIQEEPEQKSDLLQTKPIFDSAAPPPEDQTIQKKCAECEQEESDKVQRKESNGEKSASPDLSSRLQSGRGGGNPLPNDTKTQMEGAMGADFSRVRVHTGSEATDMSQGIHAQAFTHGSDIYFNEGKYDPGSTEGQRLLAHELVHTVQQSDVERKSVQRTPQKKEADTNTPKIKEGYENLSVGVALDLNTNSNFFTKELHVGLKTKANVLQLTFSHVAGTKTQTLYITPDNIELENAVLYKTSSTDGIHPLEIWIAGISKEKKTKYEIYRLLIIPDHTPGVYSLKGLNVSDAYDLAEAQPFDLGVPASFTDQSANIIEESMPSSKEGGTFRFEFKAGPHKELYFTVFMVEDTNNPNQVLCSINATQSLGDRGIQTRPSRQMVLPIPVSFQELDVEKWQEKGDSVMYRFLPPYSNDGFIVTYEINPLKKDNYAFTDATHGLNIYPLNTATNQPLSHKPPASSSFSMKEGEWQYGYEKRTVEGFQIESSKDAFSKIANMKLPDNELNVLLNEMSLIVMLAVKEKVSSSTIYSQWLEFAYGVVAYGNDALKGDDTAKQWLKDKSDILISSLIREVGNNGESINHVDAVGDGYGGGISTSRIQNKYTGEQYDKTSETTYNGNYTSSTNSIKQPFEDARALISSGDYNGAVTALRSSYYLWVEDQLIKNTYTDKKTKENFQAYGYQLSYRRQLRDKLGSEKKTMQKVKAWYYPDLENVVDESGKALYVGSQTKSIPLDIYYQESNDEWIIYNLTTLTKPGELNDFKRTWTKGAGEFAPPKAMFDLLTYDKGVGPGYIHYETLVGEGGSVRVDHPWTIGDVILTAAAVVGLIALALTGVGLLVEGAAAGTVGIGGAAMVLADIAAITTVAGVSVKILEDYGQGAPITASRWGELAIDVTTAVLPAIRSLRGIASLRKYKDLYVLMDIAANTQWLAKIDAAANVTAILVASEKGVGELAELSKALAEGRIDESTFYWAVMKNVGLGVINVVLLHSSIKTLKGRALGNTTLDEVITKGFEKNLLTSKGMYSQESVKAGVEILLDSSSVYRSMVVEALSSEKDFNKAIDVICYLGSKGRGSLQDVMIIEGRMKRAIDVLIEGKFFGKTLRIPQGFVGSQSEKLGEANRDFSLFSTEVVDGVHSINGFENAELRMQGSATMGIVKPKTPTPESSKTWDYDLAIMMEPTSFNKKLAGIFNGKVRYTDPKKGRIDLENMSNEELITLAKRMHSDKTKLATEREFNSTAHTFGNGIVTGKANMKSEYFRELVVLKDKIKKQFSIPDMDFSVISKNSSFDSDPFIVLQSQQNK